MDDAWAIGIAVLFNVGLLAWVLVLLRGRLWPAKSRRDAARSDCVARMHRAVLISEKRIDHYQVLRKIHSGQNSRVLEVYDEETDEMVAMKIITESLAADKYVLRSIRHEWDVASRFHHPAMIRVKDFTGDKNMAYFIMELFTSRNLKERIIKDKEFVRQHAGSIMSQVAEGLAYMHAQGFIHRDIKPGNILVSKDAAVRIIDFGLAESGTPSIWRRLLPARRQVQGTVSYMSPEQVRGQPLDYRSDIYSLGATFYELVAGRPPLTGPSPAEVFKKHLTEKPPLANSYNPEVSEEMAMLLQWMLEKNPDRRPSNIAVILNRLEQTPLFREDAVNS